MSWRLPPPHSSVRGKNTTRTNYISKQAVSAGSDISLALSVHFLSTAKNLQVGKTAFLIFCLFLCKSEDHLLWIQPGMMSLI